VSLADGRRAIESAATLYPACGGETSNAYHTARRPVAHYSGGTRALATTRPVFDD
jgi:hypothetical protein